MNEKQKPLTERWQEENNKIIFVNSDEEEENEAMKLLGLNNKETKQWHS